MDISNKTWLILLLLQSIKDQEVLREVLKEIKEIQFLLQIIDVMEAWEMSEDNASWFLKPEIRAARVGSGRGRGREALNKSGLSPKCYLCQRIEHSKAECNEPEDAMWCQYWETRKHNTNCQCRGKDIGLPV